MITAEEARVLKDKRILEMINAKILDATSNFKNFAHISSDGGKFFIPPKIIKGLEDMGYKVSYNNNWYVIDWRDGDF